MNTVRRIVVGALVAGACLSASAGEDGAQHGRGLYQGLQPFVHGDRATVSGLPVELTACARCHGATGDGGREGGSVAPPLRWHALAQPREGLPAFDSREAVLAAILQGQGRDGRPLDPAMPRFALRTDEAEALLDYLQRLGGEGDLAPGVTDTEVALGVILPLTGVASGTGRSLLEGLRSVFARVNATGGVHGRRIALHAQDSTIGVHAALVMLRTLPVYALVGGLWNEDTANAEREVASAHLAHVASLVVRSQPPAPGGWSADLLPPVALQYAALAQALQACPGGPAIAVAQRAADSPLPAESPSARPQFAETPLSVRWQFADASPSIRWQAVDPSLAASLHGELTGCIGYTLASAAVVQPLVPAGWSQTLVLPLPAMLLDAGASGERVDLWYRLGKLAGQLGVELLSRAGAFLHERSLLDQLGRLGGFELPPGVPLQFSRSRRYGWEPHLVQIPPTAPGASPKGD